jgi:hypothetical protein
MRLPRCVTESWRRKIKISGVFHAYSHRDSRSHVTVLVMRRKTNRGHMISDHHGRVTGIATLLLTATDGIPGTHNAHSSAHMKICGAARRERSAALLSAVVQRSCQQRRRMLVMRAEKRTVEENMSYGEWAPERATGDLGGE